MDIFEKKAGRPKLGKKNSQDSGWPEKKGRTQILAENV